MCDCYRRLLGGAGANDWKAGLESISDPSLFRAIWKRPQVRTTAERLDRKQTVG